MQYTMIVTFNCANDYAKIIQSQGRQIMYLPSKYAPLLTQVNTLLRRPDRL